jgi:hypothetical protein
MASGGHPSHATRTRRVHARTLGWVLLVLMAMLLAALAALPFVVPWYVATEHARDVVRELAREQGLELDYERLTFDPLEGMLRIEGLRLPSPPPYDEVAPHWLRVDAIELVWSPSELVSGRAHVEHLRVEGVAVSDVVDPEGVSSISAALALLSSEPPAEEVASLLSRTLADLDLPLPVRIDEVRVSRVKLERTELLAAGTKRTVVEGIELRGAFAKDDAPLDAELVVESPESGTRVTLESLEGAQELEVAVRARVTADGELVSVKAGVDLVRQTLDDTIDVSGNLLVLDATVRFEPSSGTTRLHLAGLSALGTAARAELSASLGDDAILPLIKGGEVHVELDPFVKMFPALFEGVEASGATASLRVNPPSSDGALARLELLAKVPRVVVSSERDPITVETVELTLSGDVGAEVMAFDGALATGALAARSGEDRIALPRIEAKMRLSELTPDLSRAVRVKLDASVPRVELESGSGGRTIIGALGVKLDVTARDAHHADVDVALRAKTIEAREADSKLRITGLELTTAGAYRGAMPSSFRGVLALGSLSLREGEGREVRLLSSGRLRYSLENLRLNQEQPLASSGTFHAEGRFPPFVVDVDGKLADGDGDLAFHLHTRSLRSILELSDLAAPDGVEVDETGFDLRIRGRFRRLLSPSPKLDQTLTASLTNLMLHEPGLEVVVPKVGIVVDHRGEGTVHHGTLRLELESPTMNGNHYDQPIALRAEAHVDLGMLTGRVEAALSGPESLAATLEASASVDATGKVSHEEKLAISRLGLLASVIPLSTLEEHPVELGALELTLSGAGTLSNALLPDRTGLVEGWEVKSHIEQTLSASALGARYTPPGLNVTVPEVRLDVELESDPSGSKVEAKVAIPRLDVEDVGNHHITVHGLEQGLHMTAQGALAERKLRIETDGGAARVEQDILPAYPAEDLSLSFRLVMDGFESMELEGFVLENERGGTRLELAKSLGRSGARRSDGTRVRGAQHLSLRGKVTQDLSKLDLSPATFRGRGTVTGPFSIDSADGSLFRIRASLETARVDVDLPELGLHVEGLRGNVPLEEAIEWDPEVGVIVVPSTGRNAFARVRLQDVQHTLTSDAFMEIAALRYGDVELGPMRGSMRVDRNVFYVDGIRVEKGPALITGQLVVDYLPGAELISFRGNVTGLQPAGGRETLDANAAIVFDPNRLDLDGRIQIVRIGRKHLRQLIELVDPYGEDGSLNTLRRALKLGYPKRVGIQLSEGLMSMDVQLGGVLGSLIRISEIQGIALGPFMTQHVAPHVTAPTR